MAGHHHAGVAERAVVALFLFALPQRYAMTLLQGVVGGAESDHSAADDENMSLLTHTIARGKMASMDDLDQSIVPKGIHGQEVDLCVNSLREDDPPWHRNDLRNYRVTC